MSKKVNDDATEFEKLAEFVGDGSGFEDINMSSMAVPFIRLLQDLSPQLKSTKPEYIEGAKSGQFVNTVSNKLFDAPLRIVIGKFERYYIEWGTTRGQFIAAHMPEDIEPRMANFIRDDKNKLIDPETKHSFQETYVYYVILPDHMEEGVCIVALASTAIKEAKKLNRNLMHTVIPGTNRRALPYFMIWNMEVVTMSNDQGEWNGYKFTLDTFVSQEQLGCVVEERKALEHKKVDLALIGDESSQSSSSNSSTTEDEKIPY